MYFSTTQRPSQASFSSQIWEELDISLRKQVKEIVTCHTFFHKWQVNTISDGESLTYDKLASEFVAKKIRTEIFKHNQELYDSYDTYQKIINNKNYNREYINHSNTIYTIQDTSIRGFKKR